MKYNASFRYILGNRGIFLAFCLALFALNCFGAWHFSFSQKKISGKLNLRLTMRSFGSLPFLRF